MDEFEKKPQESKKNVEPKPPSVSEAVGPRISPDAPKTANKSKEDVAEDNRLARLGLPANDEVAVRGANIVAQGVTAENPINLPRQVPEQEPEMGEMKINNFGDTVPAIKLGAPHFAKPPEPVKK
jgi:hypothetical protein